jgi:thiamine-monophosphate kinase
VSAVSSPEPGGHRLLRDVGEDGLVASIVRRFAPHPAGVVVGPGDDAAVLDVAGGLVVSTDTVVEGVDFRRDWSGGADVGVKVAAQNLADVAAMGARPLAVVVSLTAPGDLPLGWADALAEGLDDECRRAGAAVAGGDVSQGKEIVVTGTALGLLDGRPVLRSGARPGDVVALAGTTGPSAAGLALLSSAGSARAAVTLTASAPALVSAHRAPRPPYPAGPDAARAGATALIDTSDGLLRDAVRIAEASGVRIDLDTDALAPGPDLVAAAEALGDRSLATAWVLTGGEDHALLACFPPDVTPPPAYRVVGRVLDGPPQVLVDGRAWVGPGGWRHFAG